MTYSTSSEAYEASSRYNKIMIDFVKIKNNFTNTAMENLKRAKQQATEVKSEFEKSYQSNSQLRNGTVKKLYDLNTSIDSAEKQLQDIISQINSNIEKCKELVAEAAQQFKSLTESEKTWGEKLVDKFF